LLAVARERGIVFVKDLIKSKVIFNVVLEKAIEASPIANDIHLDISKDNKYLVVFFNSIDLPKYISIYEIVTGELVKKIDIQGTFSSGFFVNNESIFFSSNNNTILYNIKNSITLDTLGLGCGYYSDIDRIICRDIDYTDSANPVSNISIYEPGTKKLIKEYKLQGMNVGIFDVASDGQFALADINREVTLVEFKLWNKIITFSNSFYSLLNTFTNDGKLLLTRTSKSLNLWDISDLYSNVKDSSLYK